MLCLNRKLREAILIDGGIRIVVMEIKRNVVKLGIEAPDGVTVLREELRERDELRARDEASVLSQA